MPKKKQKYKEKLIEIDPPEHVCTVNKRYCHAHGEPQSITEFAWFPISERWSKMCRLCRERNNKQQIKWREANREVARERAIESRRKWAKDHPEEHSAQQRRWRKMNLEKCQKLERERYYAIRNDPVKWKKYLKRHNVLLIARRAAAKAKKK